MVIQPLSYDVIPLFVPQADGQELRFEKRQWKYSQCKVNQTDRAVPNNSGPWCTGPAGPEAEICLCTIIIITIIIKRFNVA